MKFEKPIILSNEEQSSEQEEPVLLQAESDVNLSRRAFLKLAGAGVASLIINPDEAFSKEFPEVPVEKIRHENERGIIGRSSNLEALHRSVSNGFEDMIEEEIKDPSKKLAVSNFKGHIGREDGKYILTYSVDLTHVDKEEKAHRVFSIRGRVWGGEGARAGVHRLYDKTIPPWQERMKEEYPDTHFTHEVEENGNDLVYQKTCIMKGSK